MTRRRQRLRIEVVVQAKAEIPVRGSNGYLQVAHAFIGCFTVQYT